MTNTERTRRRNNRLHCMARGFGFASVSALLTELDKRYDDLMPGQSTALVREILPLPQSDYLGDSQVSLVNVTGPQPAESGAECVCGDSTDRNYVHRKDLPCYRGSVE